MDNPPISSDLDDENLQEYGPLDYVPPAQAPALYGAAGYAAQYGAQYSAKSIGRGFSPEYSFPSGRPGMAPRLNFPPTEYKDFGISSSMIPNDPIAGNSITREFRESLTNVINLEFKELLMASMSVVKEAQTMFEYKGMDIWIILQKYLQRAMTDSEPQRSLVMMIVLLCERGTNFAKYMSKMSKDGSTIVNQLKNKLSIAAAKSFLVFRLFLVLSLHPFRITLFSL